MESEASVAARFAAIAPHLNERQRRLWVGAEARVLGHGGVTLVARATGVSRPTVYKALEELDAAELVNPIETLDIGNQTAQRELRGRVRRDKPAWSKEWRSPTPKE